ncbi:MAG TPA: carboxylesterase family protein, partial [Acidimicrobiales bacterium]|nr:carboxylesterase family protein [Acidimicrobiales bacterium]
MGPVVATTAGAVEGAWSGDTAVFLGIPYAQAPVGPLRFAAPEAVGRWEGTRPALEYGATAPQPPVGFTIIPEPIIEGDDCLNLNVF